MTEHGLDAPTVDQVVASTKQRYDVELAKRGGDDVARRLVGKWYAQVTYDEWFALVAQRDDLRQEIERDQ